MFKSWKIALVLVFAVMMFVTLSNAQPGVAYADGPKPPPAPSIWANLWAKSTGWFMAPPQPVAPLPQAVPVVPPQPVVQWPKFQQPPIQHQPPTFRSHFVPPASIVTPVQPPVFIPPPRISMGPPPISDPRLNALANAALVQSRGEQVSIYMQRDISAMSELAGAAYTGGYSGLLTAAKVLFPSETLDRLNQARSMTNLASNILNLQPGNLASSLGPGALFPSPTLAQLQAPIANMFQFEFGNYGGGQTRGLVIASHQGVFSPGQNPRGLFEFPTGYREQKIIVSQTQSNPFINRPAPILPPSLNIPPRINLPPSMNTPPRINLPPSLNMPPRINLPPSINTPPRINLPPTFNMPPPRYNPPPTFYIPPPRYNPPPMFFP